jgi:hypothetical protein
MDERTLTTLRLDGVPVAQYVDGGRSDPVRSPRPYLHPVGTLGGTPVTDALPADHRWHTRGLRVLLSDDLLDERSTRRAEGATSER